MPITANWTPIDQDLLALQHHTTIAGIDEVGRGCVAGPIVAASFTVTKDSIDLLKDTVKDSKKLSEKLRNKIAQRLLESGLARIVEVDANYITQHGINAANRYAFESLRVQGHHHFIDGDDIRLQGPGTVSYHVQGESKFACIAAASIVAKYHRDRLLIQLDEQYPEYGFASHKGYGTALHIKALKEHGILQGIHREVFVRSLLS